jgi:hypothetical protein
MLRVACALAAAGAVAVVRAAPEPWAGDPVLSVLATRLLSQQVVTAAGDLAALDALVDLSLSELTTPNCTFADLNYTGANPAFWPAVNHTVRARAMAASLVSPGSRHFNSSSVQAAAYCALGWWLAADPYNSNWWFRDIGVPGYVAPTAFLLWPLLTDGDVANLMTILERADYKGYTGANLVWLAGNVAWRGVLTGNRSLAGDAVAAALGTITIAPGAEEGIKADGSFFQHGAQLYNGGYGQSFAYDVTNLLSLVAGTPLAATAAQVDTFSRFLLGGSLKMLVFAAAPVDGMGPALWDVAVIGRDLSRPYGSFLQFGFGQSGQQVSWVTSALSSIGGSYAPQLEAYAAALNGSAAGPPAASLGHTHYYIGDYAIATRPGWSASLRMQSSRTLRCECVNGENALGLHLADGAHYVYKSGFEYAQLFPEWDWERIPGTTVKRGAAPLGCGSVQGSSTNDWTGGASNGDVGLAVQDFTAPLDVGLRLRRHVAFQANGLSVVLANVTSWAPKGGAADPYVVTTSIEAARLDVDPSSLGVWAGRLGGGDGQQLTSPGDYTFAPGGDVGWLWHNGTGYVFPTLQAGGPGTAGLTLRVTLDPGASGSWGAIGAEAAYGNASLPLFAVWFEQAPGAVPTGRSLAYNVVPGVPLEGFTAALTANPLTFGRAYVAPDGAAWTATLERVEGVSGGVLSVGAFANGSSTVDPSEPTFPPVTVSSAGAFLVSLSPRGLNVTVANPEQARWAVDVAVPGAAPLVASSGDGWACRADGTVAFTAPPADGSSATAVCARA